MALNAKSARRRAARRRPLRACGARPGTDVCGNLLILDADVMDQPFLQEIHERHRDRALAFGELGLQRGEPLDESAMDLEVIRNVWILRVEHELFFVGEVFGRIVDEFSQQLGDDVGRTAFEHRAMEVGGIREQLLMFAIDERVVDGVLLVPRLA